MQYLWTPKIKSVDTRNLPPRKVEPGKRHLSKEREDAFRLPVLSKADLFVDNLIFQYRWFSSETPRTPVVLLILSNISNITPRFCVASHFQGKNVACR